MASRGLSLLRLNPALCESRRFIAFSQLYNRRIFDESKRSGTGIGTEIASGTGSISLNGALGRVSLGKRLTGTMMVFSVLFALLVANLTLIMVIQADYYQNMSINNHTIAKESETERGTISTYDNVVLAQSVLQEDGTYTREYLQVPCFSCRGIRVGYVCTSRY